MALQGGTRWHCEDRIKLTLDAFIECWPELIPNSPVVRRSHYSPARGLVDELGELEAPAFVRWAYTTIREEHRGLTIKSCRSLLFLVGRWRAREGQGPEWMRVNCMECGTIHPPGPCYEESEDE